MNSLTLDSVTETLLFDWDSPRGRKVAITIFLVFSFIGHALCFYIFQIVYPPTVALLPPPARLSLITPDSEEGRTLLRWIDAEDPALAFTTRLPPAATLRALAKTEHVRSYLARCRFSQTIANAGKPDSFLVWGIATIQWGSDIARPQPPSGGVKP